MGFLIVLILLVLLLGGVFWALIGFTFGLIGLLMTLIVAGLVGWAADAIVPGELPGGWIGAVLAGLAGGFLGQIIFHALSLPTLGLSIAGVALVPAFVGAVLVAGAAELVTNSRARALPSGGRF
jgi:uncharacterized membrane protein YeaQ/YmgE (transglycosylase-associated protein family)